MGLRILSDDKPVTVVRKDGVSKAGNRYTMYSLMYSFKNGEEWKNVFVDCAFKKGTDLVNKSKIKITNAFMTGSEFNGNTKPKIFVLDYEVVEGGTAPKVETSPDEWMNIPDNIAEDLPFN